MFLVNSMEFQAIHILYASAQPHNQFIYSEEFSGLDRFCVLTGIAVTGGI